MVRYENRCNECASGLYPCVHCGLEHSPVLICDNCGQEVEDLYKFDLGEWCETCIIKYFPKVEVD